MKDDRYVAKQICLAQVASDGGKSNKSLYNIMPLASLYYKKKYLGKDIAIKKAIEAIIKSKKSIFRFYVTTKGKSYIIYFNYKIDNVKYQISFHSFSGMFEKYLKNSTSTRWLKKQSCRYNVIYLANYFGLYQPNKNKRKDRGYFYDLIISSINIYKDNHIEVNKVLTSTVDIRKKKNLCLRGIYPFRQRYIKEETF